MSTVLKMECMYCGAPMGEKDSQGVEGVSHGICRKCWARDFPDEPYPEDDTVRMCPFRSEPVIKYLGPFITPELISCPTCGRTHLRDEKTGDTAPFFAWVEKVDEAIRNLRRPLTVAVMGCEVNGPGEARQADVGIAIGKGRAAIFKHGEVLRTVPLDYAIQHLLGEIERTW
jgi:hypothetical protein